jgi:putative DNA primase/helicase
MKQRIDFAAVAAAALQAADRLVPMWLAGGKREGHEWKCGSLAGDAGHSCSVNLSTGKWADFAADERGGDLVSLYAAIFGVGQLEAAQAVAEQVGMGVPAQDAPTPTRRAAPADKPKTDSEWSPVLPVPADAPAPPTAHFKRGKAEAWWDYRDAEGRLLGRVLRFRTSDGGKEVLPYTWCRNRLTGMSEWHGMSFPEPRPLYGLDRLREGRPVLITEGEKCADAAHSAQLGYDCLSWPGGSKAVAKADWSVLAGRKVVIWPDCDAKADKAGVLMPEAKQPGVAAAEKIAELLTAAGAAVRIVAIPAPGVKPDGWDIADAIAEEGWTPTQLRTFIRDHLRLPACAQEAANPRGASAGPVEDAEAWKAGLLRTDKGAIKDARENVIHALLKAPAWAGVLGFDEFAQRVVTRHPTPTGLPPGHTWSDQDDIELARWLCANGMLIRSEDTVARSVGYVARKAAFHPVREWLVREAWDGTARVGDWASRLLGAKDSPYHRAVGRYFLINMVRRILVPGCVMRSVPVLEGGQNVGKSTALRLLADPWYSDTMFRVGDKDAYQLLSGVWLYEISELESFNRAEATAVKAFISSTVDSYRAPYARLPEKHPRQTVFAATTNADEYLKDWSGNTRFWPLRVGKIDLDGIVRERAQLFAEAAHLVSLGERSYPTAEEYTAIFEPEQERRQVAHPWVEQIQDYTGSLTRDYVTVRELLVDALKIDIARVSPGGADAQRAGQIMQAMGWSKRRGTGKDRPWQWHKPEPQRKPDGGLEPSTEDADADIPF